VCGGPEGGGGVLWRKGCAEGTRTGLMYVYEIYINIIIRTRIGNMCTRYQLYYTAAVGTSYQDT